MNSDDTSMLNALQSQLVNCRTGILVVGHGTRKAAGQMEFLTLVSQMANLVPEVIVAPAFLELAEPSIERGVAELAAAGCQAIVVVPVLLFYAGHARTDIPQAVELAADKYGLKVTGMSPPLDTHPKVIELSQLRFLQALSTIPHDVPLKEETPSELPDINRAASSPSSANANSSSEQSTSLFAGDAQTFSEAQISLAMIGRGTSDLTALDRMREVTRIRCEGQNFVWYGTGFFAGGEPKVEQLLEQIAATESPIVIVQPHLLFDGELMDQLREMVAAWQIKQPSRVWRLAATLGSEEALARVFLAILSESLSQSEFLAEVSTIEDSTS